MTLLDDFVSKDRGRIVHATWEVFHTRDPEVLAPRQALPHEDSTMMTEHDL